ncbi:MAG: SH3 domain-containing protein [Cyanobacteria bacterium P01_D01_bin.14]
MSQSQSPQPTGQWKNAVIIGGLVGGSVLLGAVLVKGFSGNDVATPTPTEPATAEVAQPATPEPAQETTTAPPAAQPTATAQPAPKPTATPQAAPSPSPAPAPRRPEVAAGANSTVSGQPGWKNVRASAGTNHGVVDTVEVGDRLQMISSGRDASGGVWYEVVTPKGRQGWIASQLLTLDTPQRSTGGIGGPSSDDGTNATIIGTAGSKNVRSGPGTDYSVAHIAYPGDRVYVRLTDRDSGGYVWHHVYFPISGAEGWMAGQLIRLD